MKAHRLLKCKWQNEKNIRTHRPPFCPMMFDAFVDTFFFIFVRMPFSCVPNQVLDYVFSIGWIRHTCLFFSETKKKFVGFKAIFSRLRKTAFEVAAFEYWRMKKQTKKMTVYKVERTTDSGIKKNATSMIELAKEMNKSLIHKKERKTTTTQHKSQTGENCRLGKHWCTLQNEIRTKTKSKTIKFVIEQNGIQSRTFLQNEMGFIYWWMHWFCTVLNHDSWAWAHAHTFLEWESWFYLVIPNGYRMMMPTLSATCFPVQFWNHCCFCAVAQTVRFFFVFRVIVVQHHLIDTLNWDRLWFDNKASFELPNHFVFFVKWLCSVDKKKGWWI